MIKGMSCLLPAILLSGCGSNLVSTPHVQGYLFSYTTVPYTLDLHNTPISDTGGKGIGIRLKEPFSGYGVSSEYESGAVGEIARKNGMTEIYFADREELSIFNVFRMRRLHIYGK